MNKEDKYDLQAVFKTKADLCLGLTTSSSLHVMQNSQTNKKKNNF